VKRFLAVCCITLLYVWIASPATLGKWSYSKHAAEELADAWDRPLVIKFSNSSGKCSLCNSFESQIECSDYWKAYASEQQLAMAYIDYDYNWDMGCYLNVVSNNPQVTSFPAFAIYASDGETLLEAFTYSADETYTAEAFVERINSILDDNDYLLDGNDIWDPTDNTPTGATLLYFELYNQRQYHDLNKTVDDTVDWFKFDCRQNDLYKLHLPPADYNIDFTSTNDSFINAVTNDYYLAVTNSITEPVTTNIYYVVTTNVISITTNAVISDPNGIFPFTNGLPKVVHISSTESGPLTVTNRTALTFGPYEYVSEGNPPYIVTNGVPQDLMAPALQIFDASLTTPLDFTLGDSAITTNLALLNQLEDGLIFAPQQKCSGEYYFIRIGQELEGELPYFETIEYYDLTTNTTVTVQTNVTETAVVTTTVTNKTYYWITYSGATNFFVGIPPEKVEMVSIITNLVNESFSSVISNYNAEMISQLSTNQIIYEGSNYVYYSYSRTQYTLNYRLWEPGIISFESPEISQRENADSVSVRVSRNGGSTGEARFAYTFEDVNTPGSGYTAENGSDFNGIDGELFWTDGEDGTKVIEVPLVQDVIPVWEGDETFAVVMSEHDDAAVLQATMAGDRTVVTLLESAYRQPGEVSFFGSSEDEFSDPVAFVDARRPAATLREGDSITLWLQRLDGSDGTVSVRVSTQSGTAQEDISFDPLSEVVTWLDGESDLKPVTIDTYELDGFTDELYFEAYLSVEQDAIRGRARKVTLRVRDALVAGTLEDTSDAAKQADLLFKSSGVPWFWNDDSFLQSAPLENGQTTLSLKLNGPGVLSFDWMINDAEPGDTLVLDGGVAVAKSLAADGATISALVPQGRQTVTWTLAAGSPGAGRDLYAVLENMMWQPVPAASNPVPADKAQTFLTDISWQMPQTYSVALDGVFDMDESNGLPLSARVSGESPSGNTIDGVTETTHLDLWGEDEPQAGKTYRWRVATLFNHADGEALNPGDSWSFKGISSEDSEETGAPPDGIGGSGFYEAVQGVFADFGEIYDPEDDISVRKTQGSLPPGLKLDSDTGRISGVPTRSGTWTLLIQARATIDRQSVYYATTQITIRVNPLMNLAGSYTGWMVPGQGGLLYEGSISLSMSDRGRMSAKVRVGGESLSFSQTGADGVDDPVNPSELYFDELIGPYVMDTDGTRLYSVLSDLVIFSDGSGTATLTHYSATGRGADQVITETLFDVTLHRDSWDSDAYKPLGEAFDGYYTCLLPVTDTRDELAPWGSSYLTLTVNADGTVRVGGMLADGSKISFKSTLLYFSQPVAGQEDFSGEEAYVYLFNQPNAYKGIGGFSGFIKIVAGDQPENNIIDAADDPLQWWNYDPQSIYGGAEVEQSTDSGFLNDAVPSGGFYDKRTNLQSFYINRTLSFEDSPDYPGADLLPEDNEGKDGSSGYLLYADILPFGTPLVIGPNSLKAPKKKVVEYGGDEDGDFEDEDFDDAEDDGSAFDNIDVDESVNLNNLSVRMSKSTGIVNGRFELYYERENLNGSFSQRTERMKWSGIITRNHPWHDPDEQNLGIQGGGFYLLEDTSSWLDGNGRTKSYKFDWSFPFELQSADEE
jgi:hypothetical protein